MNTKLLLTAVCAAAVLSGCGHLGKGMANDAEMLDKAEFATGIDRSQLSVVPGSVEGQIDSVHFRVKSAFFYVKKHANLFQSNGLERGQLA